MICPDCKGSGEVMNGHGFRGQEWWVKCPTCQGACEVPEPPAPADEKE